MVHLIRASRAIESAGFDRQLNINSHQIRLFMLPDGYVPSMVARDNSVAWCGVAAGSEYPRYACGMSGRSNEQLFIPKEHQW
jgi:hypothetical protein